MIGQVTKHGRSKRDAKNLHAHLMKDENARVELLNSGAENLHEIMCEMEIGKLGSRIDAAFLHVSVSPGRAMSDDELREAAQIVIKHFDAETHPCALVFHEKERTGSDANKHIHLVIGRVDHNGHKIESGFEKIKLETAIRIAEFELKEPSTLGRHFDKTAKWLEKNGRTDVLDYMIAQHGFDQEKPVSAASPEKRAKIERETGAKFADLKSTIQQTWSNSVDANAFANSLNSQGFSLEKGKKEGVFLVMKDGVQVGALDRILKEKRADVSRKMEDLHHEYTNSNSASTVKTAIQNGRDSRAENESHFQRSQIKPRGHSQNHSVDFGTSGKSRGESVDSNQGSSRNFSAVAGHSFEAHSKYGRENQLNGKEALKLRASIAADQTNWTNEKTYVSELKARIQKSKFSAENQEKIGNLKLKQSLTGDQQDWSKTKTLNENLKSRMSVSTAYLYKPKPVSFVKLRRSLAADRQNWKNLKTYTDELKARNQHSQVRISSYHKKYADYEETDFDIEDEYDPFKPKF